MMPMTGLFHWFTLVPRSEFSTVNLSCLLRPVATQAIKRNIVKRTGLKCNEWIKADHLVYMVLKRIRVLTRWCECKRWHCWNRKKKIMHIMHEQCLELVLKLYTNIHYSCFPGLCNIFTKWYFTLCSHATCCPLIFDPLDTTGPQLGEGDCRASC